MATTVITVKGHLGGDLPASGTADKTDAFRAIARHFEGLAAGTAVATSVDHRVSAVQAAGTVTLATVLVADTVTVGNVVFTAVASGATGAQFNQGGTDTADAESLVSAINAHATVSKYVTASNVAGVVTLTAKVYGTIGNALALASSNGTRLAVTAFTGGSDTLTTYTL